MTPFWSYWYFHLPNFVLAALMYTLVARVALGLFVPENWDNYIWRFFKTITDPVVRAVRYITPDVLPNGIVLVFAALWLMVLRLAFFVILLNLGLAPTANPGS